MKRVVLFVLLSLGVEAVAQTRCPVGAPIGSAVCLPDVVAGPAQSEREVVIIPRRPLYSRFGAIAMDPVNETFVAAENKGSEADAFMAAITACAGGRRDNQCQVFATYSNACIALANPKRPGSSRFAMTGLSVEGAERAAHAQCRRNGDVCTIHYTACANASYVPAD